MTAKDWYEKGNEARKRGEFAEALCYYNEALALDPESPAGIAKQMLEDQFAFFNKDMYNP